MYREWISCNACGNDSYQLVTEFQGWPIGHCGQCGLVYVNPIPVFEPNAEFSEMSQDFQYTRYMHQEVSESILSHERRQLVMQLAEIARLLGKPFSPRRHLEIGCGSGASVRAGQDLGWETTGIDIDPALVAKGRMQLDVDLRCVPLLDSRFADHEFDLIRLRDVIEHLPNPYECLREIRRILAPGGVVFIATPNEASMAKAVKVWAGIPCVKVAAVNPPHHLHGFSPETFRRIFDRTGFGPLCIKTTTPVDPAYVTSNNMRAAGKFPHVPFWRLSKALGRGSMLVAWIMKKEDL